MSKLLTLVLFSALFFGCESDSETVGVFPEIEITDYTLEKFTDSNGDPFWKVKFNIQEDADYIALYSGEFGYDYNYKDGRIVELDALNFSFATNCGFGGGQDPRNQLSVLMSTDFNGSYDYNSVKISTWTDITEQFYISPFINGDEEFHASGVANLSEFIKSYQSVYLAFKYKTLNQDENGIYTTIKIRDWSVNSESELGQTDYEPSWEVVKTGLENGTRSYINTNDPVTLWCRGNHGTAGSDYKTAETEAWFISAAFPVGAEDLGKDQFVAVKAIGDIPVTSFIERYYEPGEYEAVFVAHKTNTEKPVLAKIKVVIPEE
ncbi:DUF5017 domain-containing protein [Aestuariibaculum sediminum]|nr:DUF5017 domain-containing protein [Aestuariibaculum sediminum]